MAEYFEFEVSLVGTKPRVWRRFLLRKQYATFRDLHESIQDACGWQNYHLWNFTNTKRPFDVIADLPQEKDSIDIGFGIPGMERAPEAHLVTLDRHFQNPKDAALYWYDFGDDWEHKVVLKKVIESKESFYRRLTGGAYAFPPEDCGGLWGYYACIAAVKPDFFKPEELANFAEDDLEERVDWVGEDWDPTVFDLKAQSKRFDIEKVEYT